MGPVRDWVLGTALLALVVTGVALTMPLPGMPSHAGPLFSTINGYIFAP